MGFTLGRRLSCERAAVSLNPSQAFTLSYDLPEAVVRFANRGPTNISTHVHGQYNRAPFDGWASDWAYPGQYKDYHYPNAQNARTIWYHVSSGNHPFRHRD
jgi:FtsP/CotA-like multicopper oxidase with cupredoxin domain